MSAQGGTLGRLGTRQVPIWPVAVLLAAAIAAAIALSTLGASIDELAPAVRPEVTSIAQNPGMWTLTDAEAFAEARTTFPRGLENPGAYGISQVTEATVPVGLENPAAYAPPATAYVSGLENPGAYLGDGASVSIPKVEGPERVVVNGNVCHQCL
jgi:hypothetical protein